MSILSRYRPRYLRSLVYMLQASEYFPRDFLAWYRRTHDFAHVEKRKTIVWTTKAKALFALSWLTTIVWIAGGLTLAYFSATDTVRALLIVLVGLTPFYVPYMLVVINALVSLAQKPIERDLIRLASARLTGHHALKIAIAGSYGKTTMREILKTVLSAGLKVAAPPGSYNTPLGIAQFVRTLKGDEDVIIFELGEYYPGDVRRLATIVQPNIGIITGVNEAHLEKFGSLDKTTDTIFELADNLGERPLYINAENERASNRARESDTRFSREAVGEWRITGAQADLRGISFRMVRGGEIIRVSSKLLGMHLVGPLSAAAAIAHEVGLSIEQIEAGLRETTAFDHRMHMTVDNTGVITIDDSYNGNPDGVHAVIDFLASIQGHRRYYVTPGLVEMGSRTEAVHREIGERLADARIENIVLMKNSVTPYIEEGLKSRGFTGKVIWHEDMPQALRALVHSTVSGDVVLIQNDWPDQYA